MGLRAGLIVLVLAGCDATASPLGATRPIVDARGREVRVPVRPLRIVSIMPSATELLWRVGAADQVAGVTKWCTYPPEAKAKPKVGDLVVDPEALLALKADLVIGGVSQTGRTLQELEARGFPCFAIEATDLSGIGRVLRLMGDLTGHAAEADAAAKELEARIRSIESRVPARPGPTVYFEHSPEPLGTTGTETFLGEMLRRAGARNVFDGGWRLIDWESVLVKDPEVILVAHGRLKEMAQRSGWAGLKAVKSGRVHGVTGDFYYFATPRLADGMDEVVRILHGAP